MPETPAIAPQAAPATDSKPADDKPAAAPKTTEDALAASAERLRETAKWLVVAFASVGALIFAGLELKDVGALDARDTAIAIAGVATALAGVVLVIVSAAGVLAAGRVPLTDLVGSDPRRPELATELDRDSNLYRPFDSVDQFVTAISRSWSDQTEAWVAYHDAPTGSDSEKQAARRYAAAGRFLKSFNPVNQRLLATAEYANVQLAWERAKQAVVVGVIAIVAGASAFAIVSPPEDDEEAAATVASAPSPGFLHLNGTGREDFADVLGKDCPTRNLPVVALSKSSAGAYELITDPASTVDDCAVARIEVSDGEGEVTGEPLAPLELPD
ncbi:MAG: hypothetical protein M3N56_12300 [Actinomycetota bacterium]|nr:hypothetical protein [Actinomycetota bacterium]